MVIAALAGTLAACGDPPADYDPQETRSGGETTVGRSDRDAYSMPAANIPIESRDRFFVGNAFFRQPWVIAPASTDARDGLGPLYNTNTCQACHIKDGRGHAPTGPDDADATSLLVRLSVPADAENADALNKFGAIGHPVYGGQIQDRAIPGVPAEARVRVTYTHREVELAGGQTVTLREPTFELREVGYGSPGDALMTSVRVAPPMIGLGLLGAIPAADIRAHADPEDADGDGISGRVNRVWGFAAGERRIGRFGWKAGQPDVAQQTAAAFAGDLGLTTPMFDDDCTDAQTACAEAADGGDPEVSGEIFREVVFYARHLGVPARRGADDQQVLRGKRLFHAAGCAGCHRPRHRTAADAPTEYLAGQTIYPYTDLLLHDMGEALADHRPEFDAGGREWRTPPLWGIGLAKTVSPQATFLHDGRARTLLEAILWHGGEAAAARNEVKTMSETEREALLAFLESL